MNRFSLDRLNVVIPAGVANCGIATDLAVPVIDGTQLSELLDDRFPGVDVSLVAPPSRHWLGSPSYVEYERAVILDGGCGFAGCCGVAARITVERDTVRWHNFYSHGLPRVRDDLDFTFHPVGVRGGPGWRAHPASTRR